MKLLMKYGLVIIIILVLITSTLACITIKIPPKGQTPTSKQTQTSTSGPTRPHPPIRTGTITTGTKVQVASQSINTSGGTIEISKPGDPLDGFVINIPPNSYSVSRTFKVAYEPITNQSFGSDINPISPMISVDNGGGYSDEIMCVRVPVKVPDGYFAMGFIYDDITNQLEGMPLVGNDAESITAATMHFTKFFISKISETQLSKDIDSGFRPGIDDWQFPNMGSQISPMGNCEGMSLTAIWYYCTQPDGKDLSLYGRYDNNGNKPLTPGFWRDDSLAYRFCSVVQKEKNSWNTKTNLEILSGVGWVKENNKSKMIISIRNSKHWKSFCYSMMATRKPQEVILKDGVGHAMICYRIDNGNLYIADPNYRGDTERKIQYTGGELQQYTSGDNRAEIDAGRIITFKGNGILFAGITTIVDWNRIAQRWTEFKANTIGNDKFSQYELNIVDDKGVKTALTDGFTTDKKMLLIKVNSNLLGISIYRDGVELPVDSNGAIELNSGNNLLGVYIIGGKNDNPWQYLDFKYFNIKYDDGQCKTPPPADVLAKLQKTTRFKCELLNLPTTIVGSGSMQKWVPGFKFTKHFYVPGNAIKLGGDGAMPITWSGGTSFSGGGTKEYPDRLTGSVCYSGGKVLVSFDYTTNDPADNLKISVKNLPCDPNRLINLAKGGRSELMYMNTDAPVVKGFVTRLEWTSHEERAMYQSPTLVWDASLTAADWSAKCGFDLTIY